MRLDSNRGDRNPDLKKIHGRNIPLSILSVKDGQAILDKSAILQEREKNIPLDTSKPFKLNAGTTGVCKFTNTSDLDFFWLLRRLLEN